MMSVAIGIRQTIEKTIAERFVRDALIAGKRLAVSLEHGYDTDEMLLGSRDSLADHTQDSDCDVDPETNLCRVCGVDHSDLCAVCGGRAFHNHP